MYDEDKQQLKSFDITQFDELTKESNHKKSFWFKGVT
jgi:hypothetical protein